MGVQNAGSTSPVRLGTTELKSAKILPHVSMHQENIPVNIISVTLRWMS